MKQENNDRQFRMGYIQKSRQESGNQNIGGPRSLHFWKKASCQAFQKSKPKLQLRKLRRITLKPINQKFTFPKWRHIMSVRFARWLVPHTKSHSMGFGRLTHFLCLELEVSKFRCLMCSCILDMKNKEIQKTENQTCNNLCHCFDFRPPSVPYVVCVLPPQILQNSLSTQSQGNKVGRKGKVEQRRLGIYRKDAQWQGFPLQRELY